MSISTPYPSFMFSVPPLQVSSHMCSLVPASNFIQVLQHSQQGIFSCSNDWFSTWLCSSYWSVGIGEVGRDFEKHKQLKRHLPASGEIFAWSPSKKRLRSYSKMLLLGQRVQKNLGLGVLKHTYQASLIYQDPSLSQ